MRIGVTGLAGSGKDTATSMLQELTGFQKNSFAQPLHEVVAHIWGEKALERENKETPQIFGDDVFEWFYSYHRRFMSLFSERFNLNTAEGIVKSARIRDVFLDRKTGHVMSTITPRRFMQLYGTEFFRSLHDNFWVELAKEKTGGSNVIFSDVRFKNEAEICDVLLHIKRDVEAVEAHVSEQFSKEIASLRDVKVVEIDNNGSLEDLKEKLISFTKQHVGE